jgi:hypothetical protein
MSSSSISVSREYTAPVGLFGLMITIALVRSLIWARTYSVSGFQSRSSRQR